MPKMRQFKKKLRAAIKAQKYLWRNGPISRGTEDVVFFATETHFEIAKMKKNNSTGKFKLNRSVHRQGK